MHRRKVPSFLSRQFSLLPFSHFLLSSSRCFPSPMHFLLSSFRCFPSPTSFSQVLAASLLPLSSLKFSLLPFSHFLLSSSRFFPSPTSFSQVLKFLSSFCPPFYCSTVLTIFVIFSCKHLKCKQRPFFPTLIATTLTVLASD